MGLVTRSDVHIEDLPGIWHCRYWTHADEGLRQYYARIERTDDGFVLHSLPNRPECYLQAHFTVDSNLVTGSWLEEGTPLQGMLYSGVFQVIVDENVRRMVGSWVGVARAMDQPQIYEGRWEITYAGDTAEGLPGQQADTLPKQG